MTWADLTFTETQTVVAPAYIEETGATRMGLVDDTEYYVYAFSCTDGNATSPLSKAAFKTGKFTPSEECTFEITTTVERQDVTVNVVPSEQERHLLFQRHQSRAAGAVRRRPAVCRGRPDLDQDMGRVAADHAFQPGFRRVRTATSGPTSGPRRLISFAPTAFRRTGRSRRVRPSPAS